VLNLRSLNEPGKLSNGSGRDDSIICVIIHSMRRCRSAIAN